jgi:xylose dehydrogenase (NAD/NADP)
VRREPEDTRPLRIGLVGCGSISHRHAQAARATAGAEIAACCDVRADVAESWAERYGCERAYTDYGAMLTEHDLDAVLLSTWPSQHHEQVLRALDAGIRSILCEKGLATRADHAYELWSAVRAAESLLMEGFMYRHHPATRELERRLADGDLGHVAHVRVTFSAFDPEESDPADEGREWRERLECGGGVPFDLTCYGVDACNHFSPGLPTRVSAVGGSSDRYGTIDRLYALIEYDRATVGIVESTRRGGFGQGISVTCAEGHLSLPATWIVEGATVVEERRTEGWRVAGSRSIAIPEAEMYRLQLENFVAAARGEAAPLVDLAGSVVGAFTLQAALASAASGRAVEIDLPKDLVADLPPIRAGTG